MIASPRWTRFEQSLRSNQTVENPTQDIAVAVTLTHESGALHCVNAFWNGGREWLFRFSPQLLGRWRYRTQSADPDLGGQSGEFDCVPYKGKNAIYRHGAIGVAQNRRHFQHADGTPFFWLADTVWNGPLKAELRDWKLFLKDRAAKGFNGIQFVPTQWVAGAGNADLRHAYTGTDCIRIDPVFFQWLDKRIDMLNEAGMLAVMAMIWSAPSKPWALGLNPGTYLPEDQIVVLAKYLYARYGAHHCAWMLAADGDYRGELAARWQRIGRQVFPEPPPPVTMHPMGQIWVGDEFRNEPWFSFHGYQSSHWGADAALRWITQGPPAAKWAEPPPHPVVNLEACYEAHLDMSGAPAEGRMPFDDHAVRRASYWSVLASPTAGITYGAHGVWSWENARQLPMNHVQTGVTPTWREGMNLPGSQQMRYLKLIFESIPWWRLEPAQELLTEQPGERDAGRFISAAQSKEAGVAIFYLPEGGTLPVRKEMLRPSAKFNWINPATYEQFQREGFTSPTGGRDWILLLR